MAKLQIKTLDLNGKKYTYRPKYVPKDIPAEEVNGYLKEAAKEAFETNAEFLHIQAAVLVETVKRSPQTSPSPTAKKTAKAATTPKAKKPTLPKELRNPETFGWLITPPEMEHLAPETVAQIMVDYLNIDDTDPVRIKYFLKTYAQMHHQYHTKFLRIQKEIATDILEEAVIKIYKAPEWTWEMICCAKKMRAYYSFKEWVALNGRLKKQRQADALKHPDHQPANREIEAITVEVLTIYQTEIQVPSTGANTYQIGIAEPL